MTRFEEYGSSDYGRADWEWRRERGIFVLVPIEGAAGAELQALRERLDPKLAQANAPHVTLIGSSGAGPIHPDTPLDRLAELFATIAATMAPFDVTAGPAHRFLQTNVLSFPLDSHGPLRRLYERIRGSGLRFLPVRFPFSPHATVNFYATITRERERALRALRLAAPLEIRRLVLSRTNDPQPPEVLLSVTLSGAPSAAAASPG
jgi:2'-5' RNA ligase